MEKTICNLVQLHECSNILPNAKPEKSKKQTKHARSTNQKVKAHNPHPHLLPVVYH